MLTSKYRSINSILSNLLSNPLMEGITPADVARYTTEIISIMGIPMSYEDKTELIKIEDYRGELPCDILYIKQTRQRGKQFSNPMRYATDSFSSAYHEKNSPDIVNIDYIPRDHTYSLNNGMIYTGFKKGYVEMAYKAIKTDEEGFPMIPDNEKYARAVETYIKLKWYEIQWELGKIADKVLQRADQEYCWAVGAAQSYGQLQTIDQAVGFNNMITQMISNSLAGQKYFADLGEKEYFRKGSI